MVRGSKCDSHRNKTYRTSRPVLGSYYEEMRGIMQSSHYALFVILIFTLRITLYTDTAVAIVGNTRYWEKPV